MNDCRGIFAVDIARPAVYIFEGEPFRRVRYGDGSEDKAAAAEVQLWRVDGGVQDDSGSVHPLESWSGSKGRETWYVTTDEARAMRLLAEAHLAHEVANEVVRRHNR